MVPPLELRANSPEYVFLTPGQEPECKSGDGIIKRYISLSISDLISIEILLA